MNTTGLYAIQEIHGKGLGVVAVDNIAKGTRILAEAPLLKVPRRAASKDQVKNPLSSQVKALSEGSRRIFFSLHNAFRSAESTELGIVRTNALPLGSDASSGGIFPDASRINHACLQNAQNTWNEQIQKLTIHAVRDINKGEEITICYLKDRMNREDRQRTLQKVFAFVCRCQLCSLPPSRQASSDKRLDEIFHLDSLIGSGMPMMFSPVKALQNVKDILRLCEEEGICDGTVPRAYYDAFQIAIYNGDAARGRVFAERVATYRTTLEGEDGPGVRKAKSLAADPTKHSSYALESRWLSNVDDVPGNLSAEEFERWLWKEQEEDSRDNPSACRPYADLRDDGIFPSFDELPEENGIDLDFFESQDGFSYSPSKHWCFLAEIVEVGQFLRLRFLVEDKSKRKVPIAFYTDDRGNEINPSFLREGFTVAVLYGEQHGFLDMTILPISLKNLFSLSDKIGLYATDVEGVRRCQGCEREAKNLLKCARCSMFWYCDKTCQVNGWNEKGHKADCKLLKDPDLQLLLRLHRPGFDSYHEFSDS